MKHKTKHLVTSGKEVYSRFILVNFSTDNPDVISAVLPGLVGFENDNESVLENITNSKKNMI